MKHLTKSYNATKVDRIEYLIDRVRYWAKAFAEASTPELKIAWAWQLDDVEHCLAAEGFGWDEIEAIECGAVAR